MRSTWKRVLSAALTIAMIATLLVVPAAAAADGIYTENFDNLKTGTNSGTVGTENRFTLIAGSTGVSARSKKLGTSGDADYYESTNAYRFGGATSKPLEARSIKFETKFNNATMKIWFDNGSSGARMAAIWDSKGNEVGKTEGADKTTKIGSISIPTAGTYYLGASGGDIYVHKIVLTDKCPEPTADEMQLTFAVDEGATVSDFTVAGTATQLTNPINVAKNATVSFKVTPDADYYSIESVKFGDTPLTASEGVYTISDVGAAAATVTVKVGSARIPATSVTLSASTLAMKLGDAAAALTATVEPSNTTDEPTVTSSLPAVATWAEGKVTPVAIGQTTITATAGEKTATCAVTVTGPDQSGPVYTFDASKMGAATIGGTTATAYDNIFSVTPGVTVEANKNKNFGTEADAWYLAGTTRASLGSGKADTKTTKNSILFKTTAPSKVEIWWVQNAASDGTLRPLFLDNTEVTALTNIDGITGEKPAKDDACHATISNVAAGDAHAIYATGGTNYIYKIVVTEETATPVSDAPEFATNGNTAQVQKDGKVTFTLKDGAPAGASYKLYNAATGGTQMGANAAVVATEGKITFTLTDGQLTGTNDVTWYVSATETNKTESTTRTAVTLKPYIPVTSVTLMHMDPDGKTVKHELYEKMKAEDPDVTGSAENENADHPNAWQLVAVVKPDNATNKAVTFTNLRDPSVYVDVTEKGLVTAKAGGGAGQIRVASVDNPEIKIDVDVTVKVRIAMEIKKADDTAAPATLPMGQTLGLKAAVTTSPSGRESHKAVTWTTSDADVATVSTAGVVTPVGVGTVKITATNTVDPTVKAELELEITKGDPALKFTTGNPQVTSGGTVRFKLEGVPAGLTPTFSAKKGNDDATVNVVALTGDDNYNYKAEMPANNSGATVTYTITAAVAGNDNWNAATKSVDVAVLDASAKNIFIVSPGATKDVELTKGESTELKVVAQVNGAGAVKDEAATAALTYAWTKDGEDLDDTTYAITVDAAGEYVCTVTSTDTAVETKQVTVTFTVTVVAPALTTINVTADSGVDYTAATGALKITGPVDAAFSVTTAPNGHEDTVVATSSAPSVVQVELKDGKLTVTPKSAGTATITLKGTKATDVVKTINVTVVKAAAPAALTASDYTVTQPTAANGKGTIKITQSAPEGTEYVYRKGDSGDWIKFPANKTIEVEPGTYKIRVYVPQPELQETTNGVAVEIKAFVAAPTVSTVRVSSPADSVAVASTIQMTAEVRMSDNTISKTEKVTWSVSDTTVAGISTAGLVTGIKAGVVTVTATSVTDNTKKGVKTLTVTDKQGPATVDKEALKAAVTAAEGVYNVGADVEILPAGTKASTVTKGQKFVTEDQMEALGQAIADAKAVLDDDKATQADVDKAVAALNAAKDALKVQEGSKKTSSGSSSRPSSRPTRPTETVTKDDQGNTATKVTDTQGNTVITVTTENGETVAKVNLPTNIPSVDYKFVDVADGHWAEDAIYDLAGLGMVKGVNEAEHVYDMVSPVTRGSVATILYRLSNGKAGIAADFSDVKTGDWFADAVGWAAKYGVVTGFENGTFRAEASITREQLAVMLYRYAKLVGMDVKTTGNLDRFGDAASVSDWAAEAMAWAVGAGILQGTDAKTLMPTAPATRAQSACMIDRFVSLMK